MRLWPQKREAPRSSVMSEPRGSHSFFAVRRRADRTMKLSQIVHLRARSHENTLRAMLYRTLILSQRRLIAYAPIPTRVRSTMTGTAPCFRQSNGTVRSFLPTRMIVTKRVAQ